MRCRDLIVRSRQSVCKCLLKIVARHPGPHPPSPPRRVSGGKSCTAESWVATVKRPHHSSRGSHLKPVSARALTSVLCARPFNLTFTVFKFPDELILSIASHISPELIGHYARFRVQDELAVYDDHRQRVRVLRWLSMTCKTMRSRLLPWIRERLDVEMLKPYNWSSGESVEGRLNAIINASHADTFMANRVRYLCTLSPLGSELICVLRRFMTVYLAWNESSIPLFVKCLGSLQNLHTLETGRTTDFSPTLLQDALTGVALPQIKTLVMPPIVHPLLQHCHDVEDVVCVVMDENPSYDRFLGSLALWELTRITRSTYQYHRV